MSNKAPKKNRKRRSFTFENMERREMMTANMGLAIEPVEAPVAVVASPAISELSILNTNFNNSMGSATQIGTVASNASRYGSVGGSDPVDYWRFRVANSGQTTIQLAGLSRDVDIQILDSNGRVLASGVRGGTSSESVSVNLVSGRDYFVKVYPYGTGPASSYQLSINAPLAPNNNTMAGASQLGTVSTTVNARGSVGGTDPQDFWKFSVARSGQTTIQLSGMSRDVDIQIMDASGRVLASGVRGGTSAESVTVNLQAGQQYFVKVYPYGSGPVSNYQLSVTAPVVLNNDTMAGATALGNVYNTPRWVSGRIQPGNPADWYSFTPSAGTGNYARISLVSMTQDLDVQVYDSNGNLVASGTRGGSSSEFLQFGVTSGQRYFIRVFPYGSAVSNYSLAVSHSPFMPVSY